LKTHLARVGDLAIQLRGVTFAKSDVTDSSGEGLVPILRAGNITDHGLTFEDLVYVPDAKVSERQLLQPNDVVIAASSGSLSIVGKAARVEAPLRASFGAFCKVLRPSGNIDPGYFAHYFRTSEYRRRISAAAEGANINNLRSSDLNDLQIPVPAVDQQRRIAHVLDSADSLRAKRRAGLDWIARLRASLMFHLATVSRGAQSCQLDSLVANGDRINYGVLQPGSHVDGGVPIIRVADIVDGRVRRDRLKTISRSVDGAYDRSRIGGNEVLLSCVGTIGLVAVVTEQDVGSNIARAVARIPIESEVLRRYVAAYLRTPAVQRYFSAELRTVAQPTLNIKQIRALEVPLPNEAQLVRFDELLAVIDRYDDLQHRGLAQLDAVFASLQHRAFAGAL
jgi:type I restriction enzyme, S subunit